MTVPWRSIVEQLDAAPSGKQFADALNNLFSALETARDKQEAEAPTRCSQCGSD